AHYGARELFARECAQASAQPLGCGHQRRLQLVERGGASADRAAPLEQQQAQVLSTSDRAARAAKPLAGKQAPGGEQSVDQVAFTAPALAALRPLRLEDAAARGLEEAGETGAVAAAALERKGRLTEAVRPLEQRQVAGARRRHLDAVELSAEPIERD